jgi:hypothetical protein
MHDLIHDSPVQMEKQLSLFRIGETVTFFSDVIGKNSEAVGED